eukprot:970705-Amphidinium_carterae.1
MEPKANAGRQGNAQADLTIGDMCPHVHCMHSDDSTSKGAIVQNQKEPEDSDIFTVLLVVFQIVGVDVNATNYDQHLRRGLSSGGFHVTVLRIAQIQSM